MASFAHGFVVKLIKQKHFSFDNPVRDLSKKTIFGRNSRYYLAESSHGL